MGMSDETMIDMLRVYLHAASEIFERKNVLEAIKRWKKEKPRTIIPKFMAFPGFLTSKPRQKI